jgi:hypothetical protein
MAAEQTRWALSCADPLRQASLRGIVIDIPEQADPLVRCSLLWMGANLATSRGAVTQMLIGYMKQVLGGRVTTIGYLSNAYTAKPGRYLR